MEKMRRLKKTMIGIYAIMMMFMLFPMNNAANSATRQENIQKIENFLSNDAANRVISERGETYERVMRNISTLSDAQVEKLAGHANAQMVQVGGDADPALGILLILVILLMLIAVSV